MKKDILKHLIKKNNKIIQMSNSKMAVREQLKKVEI